MRNVLRSAVYPGLDLHTRHRKSLSRFWRTGPRDVLDAGSGNGYFSWLAYESGASVVALNFNEEQVARAQDFLVNHRQADPNRLRFERCNLYNLPSETRQFDEIICFEVLEHIRNDLLIASEFYRVLRPGGTLHLCCPHRLHPRHLTRRLDPEEKGGHVRAGYTEQDYRDLLQPIGFEIRNVTGIGPPVLCIADTMMRKMRASVPEVMLVPLLPFLLPIVWTARVNPRVPFSLYVQARKPERLGA